MNDILQTIGVIAKAKKYSQPFVVGGTPRDKVLGITQEIADLDITTGDRTIHDLAKEAYEHYKRLGKDAYYRVLQDGHAQINVDGVKLDFSSNYRSPGVRTVLKLAGIEDAPDLMMELLSRDFTCNSLVMTLDFETVKDPTGLGIKDIKAKLLRTCLPARVTLGDDNKRIVRVLYLAAKLGFSVDDEIVKWIKKNPALIANVKPQYLSEKLQKALNYDEEKTVNLITEMALWPHVPALPALIPYMGKEMV